MKIVTINEGNFNLFNKFFLGNFNLHNSSLIFGTLTDENIPCAVISATFCKEENSFNIRNFYVLTKFRNLGIGSKLLEKLKTSVAERNVRKLGVKLVTTKNGAALLKSFLRRKGFKDFKILCKIYKKATKSILSESPFTKYILRKNITLPKNLKLIKFKDVTNELKNKTILDENVAYPQELSPFSNEYNLKDINSLFVFSCLENSLIAWLTALDAPGNSILYRSFYVKDEYRKTNVGKFLLKCAVQKHQTDFYDKYVLFAVSQENVKVEKALPKYFTMNNENIYYEIYMKLNLNI